MVRKVSSSSERPATVAPCRRISTVQYGPSARASEAPSSGLATNRLVLPNSVRLSQTGTCAPMVAPRWLSAFIFMPVTQNGSIDGAW